MCLCIVLIGRSGQPMSVESVDLPLSSDYQVATFCRLCVYILN